MDPHKVFLIEVSLLALFVIVAGVWTLLTPPLNDEPQAYGLVGIGLFMVMIGYYLANRDRK
jgi:hypothetical protein